MPPSALRNSSSVSNLDLMWTPVKLANGQVNSDGYGFAWFIHDIRGHRIIEHEGAWQGSTPTSRATWTTRLTVVILTNLDGAHPDDLTHHVAGLYIRSSHRCPRNQTTGSERPIRFVEPRASFARRA